VHSICSEPDAARWCITQIGKWQRRAFTGTPASCSVIVPVLMRLSVLPRVPSTPTVVACSSIHVVIASVRKHVISLDAIRERQAGGPLALLLTVATIQSICHKELYDIA